MLNDATGFSRIFLKLGYTDLRKGIPGLTLLIRESFWIFLCGNTASPADGEPSVRTSGNRSCEFTRVMFCLSHIPHASKCHVQHQCL